MLHFVTSYMQQNKSSKQTLESAQYGLEISFNLLFSFCSYDMSAGQVGRTNFVCSLSRSLLQRNKGFICVGRIF